MTIETNWFPVMLLTVIDFLLLCLLFLFAVCWHPNWSGREARRHEGVYHAGASARVSIASDNLAFPVVKAVSTLKIHSKRKDALKFLMELRNDFLRLCRLIKSREGTSWGRFYDCLLSILAFMLLWLPLDRLQAKFRFNFDRQLSGFIIIISINFHRRFCVTLFAAWMRKMWRWH